MHPPRPDHDALEPPPGAARWSVSPVRIVVKVGSAVLAPQGVLDASRVQAIAAPLAQLGQAGVQSVVVTSGAVASGFRAMGLASKPRSIVQKQASAAVGQQKLMRAWSDAFAAGSPSREVAQVLLTADDFDHRQRVLNARRTLEELLAHGVVPIINENDSVSFDEIKLGDNDRLSALVAGLVRPGLLLILSSARGLYEAGDPSRVLPRIDDIAQAMAQVRVGDISSVGTGGMTTKLEAAQLARDAGCEVVIAGGGEQDIVLRAVRGDWVGTWLPAASPASVRRSRQRWIGHAARVRGTLVVDAGAARALRQRGASLLPTGVREVRGTFPADAMVEVVGEDGIAIARGLVAYDSSQTRAIAGKRSDQIEGVLGFCYREEVIHRDDLVLIGPRSAAQAARTGKEGTP